MPSPANFAKRLWPNEIDLLERNQAGSAHFWARRACDTDNGQRSNPAQCVQALAAIRDHISGNRIEEALEILEDAYGGEQTGHSECLTRKLRSASEVPLGQEEIEAILQIVDEEIEQQELKLENSLIEIDISSRVHEPSQTTLDNLLRYQAANLRDFKNVIEIFDKIRKIRNPKS